MEFAIRKVIKNLRRLLKCSNDTALCKELGISQSTLSSWYKRNSIGDWELVFSKCKIEDVLKLFSEENNPLDKSPPGALSLNTTAADKQHDNTPSDLAKKIHDLEIQAAIEKSRADTAERLYNNFVDKTQKTYGDAIEALKSCRSEKKISADSVANSQLSKTET